MVELAQTYIHLSKVPRSLGTDEKFADLIQALALNIAPRYYGPECLLELELEEGSIKARLAVLGALYLAIGEYGDFRSGLDQLIRDARAFSQHVIADTIAAAGVPEDDVIRLERRLGLPGQIRRALERLETNDHTDDEVRELVLRLLTDVADAHDRRLIFRAFGVPEVPNDKDQRQSDVDNRHPLILQDDRRRRIYRRIPMKAQSSLPPPLRVPSWRFDSLHTDNVVKRLKQPN